MGQQVVIGECAFTRKPHICPVLLREAVGQHAAHAVKITYFSILTIGQSHPPARFNT